MPQSRLVSCTIKQNVGYNDNMNEANTGNILGLALDGFELNDPASGYILPPQEIQGLFGAPELRVETGDNFGRDGGWINQPKYKPRIISLEGQIGDRNHEELERKRRELVSHLSKKGHDFVLRVRTYAGFERYISVRVLRNPFPALNTKNRQTYELELYASDPLYYDYADGELMTIVRKIREGGFDIPFNIPFDIGASTLPTVITNTGTEVMKPVIKIKTPATNPTIINKTTGGIMKINVSVGATDELVIDMKQNKITLNGENIYYLKADFATFWGLQVGDNEIELITELGSEPTEAEVYYSSAFVSI